MNYFVFLLYYLLTSFVLILLILFIYRFFIKHKCKVSSKIAEKAIDDYFKAFDVPDDKETLDFTEEIHVLDSSDSKNTSGDTSINSMF